MCIRDRYNTYPPTTTEKNTDRNRDRKRERKREKNGLGVYDMNRAGNHTQLGAVLYVNVMLSPGSSLTKRGGMVVAVDELHTVYVEPPLVTWTAVAEPPLT